MNYVYIVEAHYHYEGFDVVGVYNNAHEAVSVARALRSKLQTTDAGPDEVEITKHEINKYNPKSVVPDLLR